MYFQKDYILRMIEMMGDFMRAVGDMLDDMERRRALENACEKYCGMSLKAAEGLSIDTLTELLPPQARLSLSEIIYISIEKTRVDPEERQRACLRAAQLLLTLSDEEALSEKRAPRLHDLLLECDDLLLPEEQLRAAGFFLSGGRFDWAEDAIFASAQADPDLIPRGEALLSSLLEINDEALTLGGLPREDVLLAISDLQRIKK